MRVLALLSVLLLVGCGDEDQTRGWRVTVDSLPGGTRHVVNTPPVDAAAPRWRLVEELRIGSVDGDGPSSFGQIKGLAPMPDGGVAVLESMAKEIRVFGADGAHLATHGKPGEGPGEFVDPYGLMVDAGGRFWVPDTRTGRMSVVDPVDGFVESYSMRLLSYSFIWRGAMTHDGRIIKPSMTLGPPRRDLLRVFDESMTLVDSILLPVEPEYDREDPPGAFYWKAPNGNAMGYMGVPFYAGEKQLLDPRGGIWSTDAGDPSYRIRYWRPGGDTTLVIENRRPPVPVTEQERDSVISAMIERLKPRGGTNQDWSKIPEVKPSVLTLFLSQEGELWVETPVPDGPRRYDRYARDGVYMGSVESSLPILSWLRPVVRGETMWAVVTDPLDVQYVVRARIVSAGRDAGRPSS